MAAARAMVRVAAARARAEGARARAVRVVRARAVGARAAAVVRGRAEAEVAVGVPGKLSYAHEAGEDHVEGAGGGSSSDPDIVVPIVGFWGSDECHCA